MKLNGESARYVSTDYYHDPYNADDNGDHINNNLDIEQHRNHY